MTLKIQRNAEGEFAIFALSGRISAENVTELEQLLESGADGHKVVLDLKEVRLVDRDVVRFLSRCEADGAEMKNCAPYIREWIDLETVE